MAVLRLRDGSELALAVAQEAPETPCFRCGVCCVKWQPLLGPQELKRLAAELGVTVRTFKKRYTRPYPLRRGWHQLRTGERGCIFLTFEGNRAGCAIHSIRPQVCRDWAADLGKTECQQGLREWPTVGLLPLEDLLPEREQQRQMVRVVEGASGNPSPSLGRL